MGVSRNKKHGLSVHQSLQSRERENIAERSIPAQLRSTFGFGSGKIGKPLIGVGHYAGLLDFGNRVLAIHADGVGSKILIAQMLNRYDTIGVDCVAMNVNDIICLGAEPISMVDYMAIERPDRKIVQKVIAGLVRGAKEAGVSIVGGETAIMPDIIRGVGKNGLDLTGSVIGVVDKKGIITGEEIKVGDVVVGAESSGIHSNGMLVARTALFKRYRVDQYLPSLGRTVGEELLIPTRIYVKPVLEILKRCRVHGLAHITGGGFSKLHRLVSKPRMGILLDTMPKPPQIFKLIQNAGKISDRGMYGHFNMGVGFCIFAPRKYETTILRIFKKYGIKAMRIGEVTRSPGVVVNGIRL